MHLGNQEKSPTVVGLFSWFMALTGFCDLAAKLTIVAGSAQHKLSQELAPRKLVRRRTKSAVLPPQPGTSHE
jgi:hypothetical protein